MRRNFLCSLFFLCTAGFAHAQSPATLNLVFVLDGLRPDSITEADTPTLYRLRKEGVAFQNTHSVFPTVTRVNSTSLGTGSYPARHGIMGNTIYVPAVDPQRAFSNDDFQPLLKLDEATGGRMVTATGLAEILAQQGRSMVVVSSGSTGSALLLAPKSPGGIGTLISGDLFPGTQVAFPSSASDPVLKRFGPAPKKGGATDQFNPSVDWAMQVLRDYVLPELKPAVVFTWMSEPDHTQHALGPGAPEAVAAIRNDDRQLGLVLEKLETLGLRNKTNIMVVSDHGFAQTVFNVNVGRALADAGMMTAGADDVVIASSGQAVALHVKDRSRVPAIAAFLQRQPWCGVVFTAAEKGGAPHQGTAPGTFSLEFVHLSGHERSPDIVFTFPWSSAPNNHGARGTEYAQISGKRDTEPYDGKRAGHGGIGPWTVRNTMLAWGPAFKHGAVVRTPTSNVDVAPTLLHLLGQPNSASEMDGRVIAEALANGPDEEQVAMETRTWRVSNGAYAAVLQTSETGGKRYIDKGWREK